MDFRRLLLALSLSFIFIFVWQAIFMPPQTKDVAVTNSDTPVKTDIADVETPPQNSRPHLNDLENPFADGANDVGGSKFKFGCKSASQFAEQLRKQQREIQSKVGVKLRQGFQNIEPYEENESFSSI